MGESGELQCTDDERDAIVVLHAGSNEVNKLIIKHLDGISLLDSFDVYVNSLKVDSFNDNTSESTEVWRTTEFDVSSHSFTGDLTIKLRAIDAIWSGCSTYGQVSIDWIKLYGCGTSWEPYCGDGILDPNNNEECDDNGQNGQECTPLYGGTCTYCSNTCEEVTLTGSYCGDGEINGDEQCDGSNFNGYTCQTVPGSSYTGGTLVCGEECTFDTSGCTTSTGGTSGGGTSYYTTTTTSAGVVAGAATEKGKVAGASTVCIPYLLEYIKLGADNSSLEVMKLELFLNAYLGINLPINGIYEEADYNAVMEFQLRLKNDILAPWAAVNCLPSENIPTGYVYRTTKWAINNIFCPELRPDVSDERCFGSTSVGLGEEEGLVAGAAISTLGETDETTTTTSTIEPETIGETTTTIPQENGNVKPQNWIWVLIGLLMIGGLAYLVYARKQSE